MKIIIDVLLALQFDHIDDFSLEYAIEDKDTMIINTSVLVSKENNSQVFLVIDCKNEQLKDYTDGKIIKEIALKFRKKDYHRAEMDRNTTLLLACESSSFNIDMSSKIKIEDDPYYFKKYVFSYDESGLKKASDWLKDNNNDSIIMLIQKYISNTNYFSIYKENQLNEPIYSFFVELVAKLHCFPMKTVETRNIKNVGYFLDIELNDLKNNKKNPIEVDRKRVEMFNELDVDFNNVEDVCQKWKSIYIEG